MDRFIAQRGWLVMSGHSALAAGAGLFLILVAAFALWSNIRASEGGEALLRAADIQASALTFLGRVQDAESGPSGIDPFQPISQLETKARKRTYRSLRHR